jgi:single-strand DNA-binding protein
MAGEPTITITGNVAGDPDLRYSPNGVDVVGFTVASTPREKDKTTGNWVDKETLWVRVTAFRDDAVNAAESLVKGSRVVVTGRLSQESWETKDGEKRTTMKLIADEIGASLKWATVKIAKAERGRAVAATNRPPADDPWAAAPAEEEPPF